MNGNKKNLSCFFKIFFIGIDIFSITLFLSLLHYWTEKNESALGPSVSIPIVIFFLNILMIISGYTAYLFFKKNFEDKNILKISKITYSLGWWILLSMPILFVFLSLIPQ
jgi:hypothetical protein